MKNGSESLFKYLYEKLLNSDIETWDTIGIGSLDIIWLKASIIEYFNSLGIKDATKEINELEKLYLKIKKNLIEKRGQLFNFVLLIEFLDYISSIDGNKNEDKFNHNLFSDYIFNLFETKNPISKVQKNNDIGEKEFLYFINNMNDYNHHEFKYNHMNTIVTKTNLENKINLKMEAEVLNYLTEFKNKLGLYLKITDANETKLYDIYTRKDFLLDFDKIKPKKVMDYFENLHLINTITLDYFFASINTLNLSKYKKDDMSEKKFDFYEAKSFEAVKFLNCNKNLIQSTTSYCALKLILTDELKFKHLNELVLVSYFNQFNLPTSLVKNILLEIKKIKLIEITNETTFSLFVHKIMYTIKNTLIEFDQETWLDSYTKISKKYFMIWANLSSAQKILLHYFIWNFDQEYDIEDLLTNTRTTRKAIVKNLEYFLTQNFIILKNGKYKIVK